MGHTACTEPPCLYKGAVYLTFNCTHKLYLLTPWSRVVLEKLTGSQLVNKFPAYYGTRRFITAFTSARHRSLSRASSIHSMPPHPTCWRSILIYTWVYQVVYFPQFSPPKHPLSHTCNTPHLSHFSRFDHINILWKNQSLKIAWYFGSSINKQGPCGVQYIKDVFFFLPRRYSPPVDQGLLIIDESSNEKRHERNSIRHGGNMQGESGVHGVEWI